MQDRHEVVLEANITNFKNKMKEAQNISKEVGKKVSNNTKFGVWKDGVYTLSNGMQFVKKETKEVNQEIKDTGEISQKAGNEISTAFNKGLKSVKKLTLGFLGARSAFGLFRKYMSEYSSENEVFAQKMQLTTSVIANALAPAFEFFGNVIQYVVIGLARVVELLFGVNILGKTMDNSLKKASKSAKELNDNLSGLDEISNIDQAAGGLSTGIGGQLEALNDFKKKIEEVKELFKKWGVEEKINTIKTFLKELWNSQVMQEIKKLIGNIVDWSIKHPNAVATILGGMALINLIGKIMGATGGTGLLGLVGNLKYLTTLGTIAITIAIAHKVDEKVKDYYNEQTKETKEGAEKFANNVKETNNKINKAIQQGDVESARNIFDDRLKNADKLVETINKLNSYKGVFDSNFAKTLDYWTDTDNSKNMKKNIEDMKKTTKEIMNQNRELYNSGLLTKEQEENYKKLIMQQIIYSQQIGYTKDETRDLITEYLKLNNSKENVAAMIKYMQELGYTQEEIRTSLAPYFNEFKTGTDNVVSEAKNTKKTISDIFTNPIPMKLSLETSSILGSVSSAVNLVKSAFSKIGLSVPSYDVGTDYVPRDQLAMIHEGERIIPKKYNNSQYMGNDETNSLLMELNRNVLELASKPTTLNVNGKELAKATYSDYQEESSRRGSNMSVRRV